MVKVSSPYLAVSKWVVGGVCSALNRAAPSAKIPAYENPLDYPWSVQVDNLIGPEDLMNFYRTFYEDTQFDMEKGALGGFFGLPYRLEIGGEGGSSYPNTKGQFARGLSIPRTAYWCARDSDVFRAYPRGPEHICPRFSRGMGRDIAAGVFVWCMSCVEVLVERR